MSKPLTATSPALFVDFNPPPLSLAPSFSSNTDTRVQISVNGGASGGAFASCFNVGSGVACGAVSATLVTVVDQMYEVKIERTGVRCSYHLIFVQVHIDLKSTTFSANPFDSFGAAIGTTNM